MTTGQAVFILLAILGGITAISFVVIPLFFILGYLFRKPLDRWSERRLARMDEEMQEALRELEDDVPVVVVHLPHSRNGHRPMSKKDRRGG